MESTSFGTLAPTMRALRRQVSLTNVQGAAKSLPNNLAARQDAKKKMLVAFSKQLMKVLRPGRRKFKLVQAGLKRARTSRGQRLGTSSSGWA